MLTVGHDPPIGYRSSRRHRLARPGPWSIYRCGCSAPVLDEVVDQDIQKGRAPFQSCSMKA